MHRITLFCLSLTASHLVVAQTVQGANETLVEFSTEATRSASNDLYRATAFVEDSHLNAAQLARQVNQQITQALSLAKAYPTVKVQTGNSHTQPLYAKNSRTVETWRMRSDLQLESRDSAALADLLGKLQGTLAVSQLSASPAQETRQKAEAEATVAAIQAFRSRADVIATTLGKKYRIREMQIGTNNSRPAYPAMLNARSSLLSQEAASMPMEGGDSQVVVNINGKIEIRD